jgi:hypothetical protein
MELIPLDWERRREENESINKEGGEGGEGVERV